MTDAPNRTAGTSREGAGRRPRAAGARLSGPGAFEAVFDQGLRREGRYVQIVYLPASGPPAAPTGRFGFVVSRKAMRRAVDRNRFKRVIRERLRLMHATRPRFDLVIRVKRAVDAAAVDAAAAEAVALIERLLVPGGASR